MKTLIMLSVGVMFAAANVKIDGTTYQALCREATQIAFQAVRSRPNLVPHVLSRADLAILDGFKSAMIINPTSRARNFITELVRSGVDVNTYDVHGEPLLISFLRDYDLTKFLLERKADPDARDANHKKSSLHWAMNDVIKPSTLKLLLDHKATVDARDPHNNTPLHLLALRCRLYAQYPEVLLEKADLMIEKGAKLDLENEFGQTPLQIAEAKVEQTRTNDFMLGDLAAKILFYRLSHAQSQGLKELLPSEAHWEF
jgi:ankyrin repeat protein